MRILFCLILLSGCVSTDQLFSQASRCTENCDQLWASYNARMEAKERRQEVECPRGYVHWKQDEFSGCVSQNDVQAMMRQFY